MFIFDLFLLEESPPGQLQERPNNASDRRCRFVQLYTSRSYESRRSELVNPPEESSSSNSNELRRSSSSDNLQQHVLSPRLVDAISKTAQVVWATTKKQEGLIGRSDIRLQTAVGMPVAMDRNGNMCVVVMFSPNNVQSTDDAMEYLYSISQSATSSSIPFMLPVFDAPAVGVRKELLPLPVSSQEPPVPDTSPSSLGEGVIARFVSLDVAHSSIESTTKTKQSDGPEVHSEHDLTIAPKDTFGIPMLPSFAELGNGKADTDGAEDAFDEATYGIWTTIMENNEDPLDNLVVDADVSATDTKQATISASSLHQFASIITTPPPLKESRKHRLVEFCMAFLGMSVFDLADVWVPSDVNSPYPSDTLSHLVTVTSSDSTENTGLAKFQQASERTLIKFWNGAVGRAFCTGNPVWSSNENNFIDSGRNGAFQQAHFRTVLAVPVISKGATRPSCVVSTYACVKSESVPFVLKFVQQALRVLWDGLDRIDQPHVSTNVWENVAPADLGEMAADVEMQQHFQARKRTHQTMISSVEPAPVPGSSTSSAVVAKNMTSQLQSIQLPNGDVITVPIHLEPSSLPAQTAPRQEIRAEELQNHMNDALRSVAHAFPAPSTASTTFSPPRANNTASAPKRAHLGAAVHAVPLAMPQPLPSQIIAGSNNKSTIARQGLTPSVPLSSIGIGALPSTNLNQVVTPSTTPPLTASTLVPSASASTTATASMVAAVTQDQAVLLEQTSPLFCLPVNNMTPSTNAFNIGSTSIVGKICRIEGCEDITVSRRPYCAKHSGTRKCEHPDCPKCAQGSTKFCIAHGGGRRCTFPGCDKGARDKFFCAAHGGGKRCQFAGGCTKSAVGGSSMCTAHGGGRRCDVPGCGKSAQSSTKFCVKHGGGKKCAHAGCEKVARGRTSFCASHGGGIRCKLEGCNRVSIGKLQLCRAHGGGSSRGGGGGGGGRATAPSVSSDTANVAIIVENRVGTNGATNT